MLSMKSYFNGFKKQHKVTNNFWFGQMLFFDLRKNAYLCSTKGKNNGNRKNIRGFCGYCAVR